MFGPVSLINVHDGAGRIHGLCAGPVHVRCMSGACRVQVGCMLGAGKIRQSCTQHAHVTVTAVTVHVKIM